MITWTILDNYRTHGLRTCVNMHADKLRHIGVCSSRAQARRHALIWVRLTLSRAIDRGVL